MDSFSNFLRALGPGRILAMLGVTAGLIGFFFFMIMQLSQPNMSLLYSNLELEESATVMQRLDGLNVPYELQNNGRTIYVPREQVATLRVSLAGEGLGGRITGYEIFDGGDTLGTTSFVQNINRVRAIEGELSRTITVINAINSARVHIVLPERQLFQREARKPTASIVLRTNSAGLARSQVRAIQYLVSAAVPGLDPESISIVDQTGALLARGRRQDAESDFASDLEEKRTAYESRLRNQIENLLGNTVGMGHVRAEVAVQMSHERITTNSESFDPDSQVVRSSNTIEEITSNRESTPGGEVTVGNNLPDAQAAAAPSQPATSSTERTEATTNFEISKTVTTRIKEAGEIEKITVAVLVDGVYIDDAEGVSTYQPRNEAELDQLEALVRSTIGFDPNRGDTIEIVNLQFIELEEAPPAIEPFSLMGLSKDDLFRILTTFVWGVVGILVLLLIVRPLIRRLIDSIPSPEAVQAQIAGQPLAQAAIAGPAGEIPAELAAGADPQMAGGQSAAIAKERAGIENQIDVASVEGRVQDSALKKVGDIVAKHPDEAASIVRGWLYSD